MRRSTVAGLFILSLPQPGGLESGARSAPRARSAAGVLCGQLEPAPIRTGVDHGFVFTAFGRELWQYDSREDGFGGSYWTTDGSTEGTLPLRDPEGHTIYAVYGRAAAFAGHLIFVAADGQPIEAGAGKVFGLAYVIHRKTSRAQLGVKW